MYAIRSYYGRIAEVGRYGRSARLQSYGLHPAESRIDFFSVESFGDERFDNIALAELVTLNHGKLRNNFV